MVVSYCDHLPVVVDPAIWFREIMSKMTLLMAIETPHHAFVETHLLVCIHGLVIFPSSLGELLGSEHSHGNLPCNVHLFYIFRVYLVQISKS